MTKQTKTTQQITYNEKNWMSDLMTRLNGELADDKFWSSNMKQSTQSQRAIHLAIFVEPFLSFVFEGRKTIESRFSINRTAPYQRISKGDVILLKKSGGPILGICNALHVWSYKLDKSSWKEIKQEHAKAICALDPSFWKQREQANYATLIKINHVRKINPIEFIKSDRRGWIVLDNNRQIPLFND